MEAGIIATLVIGSLLTTGAVAGVASMNGDMMQGTMDGGSVGGWYHSTDHGMMHDHDEHEYCEEYEEECEDWENGNLEEMHEECEEHMEERENEHSFEDEDHEEHDHCGMMG